MSKCVNFGKVLIKNSDLTKDRHKNLNSKLMKIIIIITTGILISFSMFSQTKKETETVVRCIYVIKEETIEDRIL